MCYAIPGKVIEINEKIITLDYFGQKRKARNDFYDLNNGDYVLAQGGFIVQKVSSQEAKKTLKIWEELFFKLQEIDKRLAYNPQDLHSQANSLRQKHLGNTCCVHGILEFSNYCKNNCLYCGLRKNNSLISRYRMTPGEIIKVSYFAIKKLKFKALVLQSGEDLWYTEEKLTMIIKEIMKKSPALLILSVGEREIKLYEKLYKAGSRAVLLRFESSNPRIYSQMRPEHNLQARLDLIKKLRNIGYLVMTGFLIGLPGQTQQDILKDIKLTSSLGPDMFSFGPFIPHPQTPLANSIVPSENQALDTISRSRLMNPEAKILVTTALETLDRKNGLKQGLLSGGNSLMINITPWKYQKLYDIYPGHTGTNIKINKKISTVLKLLKSIGRAPVDLGL